MLNTFSLTGGKKKYKMALGDVQRIALRFLRPGTFYLPPWFPGKCVNTWMLDKSPQFILLSNYTALAENASLDELTDKRLLLPTYF